MSDTINNEVMQGNFIYDFITEDIAEGFRDIESEREVFGGCNV